MYRTNESRAYGRNIGRQGTHKYNTYYVVNATKKKHLPWAKKQSLQNKYEP